MNFDWHSLQKLLTTSGLNFLYAIIILVIGWKLARLLSRLIRKVMLKSRIDSTLSFFTSNMIQALLIITVIIAALSKIGINTSSLIAILGTAGLAVGLAMQNSLSNLAAGIMIVIFKPFKVGDVIEITNALQGTVEEIDILNSQLSTPDHKTIIIPNSKLLNETLVNYSAKPERRIDMIFLLEHAASITRAKEIAREILATCTTIIQVPEPQIGALEAKENGIALVVRPWVKRQDYMDTKFVLTEKIIERFQQEGIPMVKVG